MHRGIAKGLAVVGVTGALIGGGAALANAASGGGSSSGSGSSSQPNGTTPAAPSQPMPGHHCPHMGGGSGGSGLEAPGGAPSQST
jgi:hypothetical protein